MESKSTSHQYFKVISFAVLAAAFAGIVVFFDIKIAYLINSDMASEMILGKLVASENADCHPKRPPVPYSAATL